jgi:toxin ParE1/3/4
VTPVALSPQAARDIESIGDYIARDNPGRAATFVRELRQRCADIGHMPQAYPRVPGSQGLRRVVHGRHLIFYREAGGAVRVERVLHGARDYGGLL